MLESKDKCKESRKDEPASILCKMFYVMSVRMSGEIILEDQKLRKYGPDGNQGHLFFVGRR